MTRFLALTLAAILGAAASVAAFAPAPGAASARPSTSSKTSLAYGVMDGDNEYYRGTDRYGRAGYGNRGGYGRSGYNDDNYRGGGGYRTERLSDVGKRYGPYNDGYRGGGYSNYGGGGGRRVSDLYNGGGGYNNQGYNDYDRYGRRGYSSGRLSDQGKYGNYGPYQDGYGRGGGLVRSSSNYGDLYNNNRGGTYGGGYRSGRLSDQGKYYNDAYGYNDYGRNEYRSSGYSSGAYGDNRYSGGLTPYYQNQYGRGSSTYKPLFGDKTYLNDYGYGDRSGYSPYYNPDRDAYYHQPQTSGERNSY